ncbi:MAG: helix-turn-helix domain-containing protein [Rhodobacter sp.]|nr:helix-turn-helix domain-containing protein [Rhodobacter sp.]
MDAIFKALNDPSRRVLLDSLRRKDGQSLQELEEGLEMTRFGVMKHLKVLEASGLVVSVKRGRFKYHYLNAVPLQEVLDRWIEPLIAKPQARHLIDLKAKLEGAAQMTEKPDFMMQTFIRTTQDALWDALTDPEKMGAYHFMASAVEGDHSEGGTVVYKTPDGNSMLETKVLKLDPKSRIETTFEPKWLGPDTPASRCVYLIEVEGPMCKLTLEHYGIPPGLDDVAEGWAREFSSLKSYLETGEPLKAPMGGM